MRRRRCRGGLSVLPLSPVAVLVVATAAVLTRTPFLWTAATAPAWLVVWVGVRREHPTGKPSSWCGG